MATNIQPTEKIPVWRDERYLSSAAQILSSIIVIGLLYWMASNFVEITNQRGISLSYKFLSEPAGFPISESTIPYDPTMSFGRAFIVGLANTLTVSVTGIVLASILGFLIGLARLSSNWLFSRLATAFIEFHRNIPLLVLLFLWYFGVFNQLPLVKNSVVFPGPIYLNIRGLYLTWPRLTETGGVFAAFLVGGLILSILAWKFLISVRERTGRETYYVQTSVGILIALPLIGWFASGGAPLWLDVPVLEGFNFKNGLRLSTEFGALLVGLTTYTAAFIAEVVRSGIQAVDRGQTEAAKAVGLSNFQVLRLIVIPQAMRVIIPPLISQYLNLTKNSSLALAIGYQDLFAVGKVTINQAGRAVPVFLMVMATYLILSLITSFILNIYNRRIQFVER
ncbi:MAG TPA: amino acid ABC transporter permease [Anaerolineae bacterium]|nr:amino acid ABC transporter permease [Anaerolineae bacterium]